MDQGSAPDASNPSEPGAGPDAAVATEPPKPPSITDLCAEPDGWTKLWFPAAAAPPVRQGSYVRLGFDFVAVRYARALDRFVSVSAAPPTLRVFDARGNVERSLTLSKVPSALALAPNAKRAVVGHADSLTVVDLESGALRSLSFVPGVARVLDGGGAFVYLTASGNDPSGPKALYSVELATGAVTPDASNNISFSTDGMVLDPVHQRIYKQSTTQYLRWDIGQGVATLAAAYQPEQLAGCGQQLYITDDGTRLVNGCGSVFRATDAANVMVYDTSVPLTNALLAADHSVGLHQLAAVFSSNGISTREPDPNAVRSQVFVFEDEYFDQVQSATLPEYEEAGQRVPLWAQQLEYSADDQKLYVIAQTPGGSALSNRNVLVTLPSKFERPAIGKSPDPQPYELLHANIRDAERSRTLDRIVYISQDPDKLAVLDANRHSIRELELPRRAEDLTLDADGTHAVVAFDGRLGYYELDPLRLVHMWPVPEPLSQIAIDRDGYVYDVFSSSHKVRIDIASGAVESGASQSPLSATGHYLPSEHALVVAGADSLVRTEIHAGQLGPSVKSNVDYFACWEFWPSVADSRLFGACGHVFSAKAPMLYRGTIPGFENASYAGSKFIEHLDHSAASKLIAFITRDQVLSGTGTPRELSLVEDRYYAPRGRVRLPAFKSADEVIPAYARYAFFSADGKRLDILAQSARAQNVEPEFGLISASVDHLPSCPQEQQPATVRGTTAENVTLDPLGFDVIDAVYSTALDRIVVASSDPPKLRLLDPISGAVTAQLELPLAPTRVELNADRRSAVVGHDGWLSTVALEPPQVTSTLQISASPVDISLQGGLAYVSPLRDQTTVLRVVDLASGSESLGVAVRAGRRQRITPDGLSLLSAGADTHLHRMPLETARTPSINYVGSDGGAVVAQNAGRAFWYSADQRKLFGSSGAIFDISDPQATTYPNIGRLQYAPSPNDLRGFAEHAASNRLAVLPNYGEGVELYDGTTYTRLAYYGMPGFATDSATVRSSVRFVFFTRDGQQLDVLVAAISDQPVSARAGFVRVPVTSASP